MPPVRSSRRLRSGCPSSLRLWHIARLADHRRSQTLTKAAAAVVGIGLLSIAFVAAVPGLVVALIGGAAYDELTSEVWIFAAIGAAYHPASSSPVQPDRSSKRAAIAVLWIATAALMIPGLALPFLGLQIALVVLCVACALALIRWSNR